MVHTVKTAGGVNIDYEKQSLPYPQPLETLINALDSHRGALFTSSFEYPGRYTCWDIGFYNPPVVITCSKKRIVIEALNKRGEIILALILLAIEGLKQVKIIHQTKTSCEITIISTPELFSEEERSRQPSVFTVLRQIIAWFKTSDEPYLGLYGAFGYDTIFQFEALDAYHQRDDDTRDLVLYFPDEIFVVNHPKEEAFVIRYDFNYVKQSTTGMERSGICSEYNPTCKPQKECDHEPGEYAEVVLRAKERFACGDLFEVVPSQTFYLHSPELPSTVFKRMRDLNPAPYGLFINLGHEEYLVGASPEMYVRVQGNRVETCPISGTIKRGNNAIEDAFNIQTLLDSEKEFSELTMCTDVDRNDKSRICKPGSVQVIGRRQIEMYSRLIHTVDHVEGILRPEFDALDAFLTHMWVVTVTGAPKIWAMNFIEQNEKSPRKWYGGAVGWLNFNGDINTGLVLRTLQIKKGIAEIRVGATLLYDSDPQAEEQETRLKASAFIDLLTKPDKKSDKPFTAFGHGRGKKVLLIDHQDSFVHTLANYIRQTGADVLTIRYNHAVELLEKNTYDLVFLSPGPGKPEDFNLNDIISTVMEKKIPLFGVCLGLQGIVEYFGGRLGTLDYPMHGKTSTISVLQDNKLFAGLDQEFVAGRYHSLYAEKDNLPADLEVTAVSDDRVVMALSHRTKPVYAVQFHPETILSMPKQAGLRIISNLMKMIAV